MKQGISVAVASLGLLVLGPCCSLALAAGAPGTGSSATVTTTMSPSATSASSTTYRPAVSRNKRVAPPKRWFPVGVRIVGVPLAGLDVAGAEKAVGNAFARPLTVTVDGARVSVQPTALATAYVPAAVAKARVAAAGENVQLVVSVRGAAVRALVARLARRVDKSGTPARLTLTLRAGKPYFVPDRLGRLLAQTPLVASIVHALVANTRLPIGVRTQQVMPGITTGKLGPVILINRTINRLTLFARGHVYRFPVATGQAIYPTPAGVFHIVVMEKNPWWYPPTYDAWAKGLKPVPPGPYNPLGTRWMGLSVPGVGIHGTDAPTSIGYNASHGCIRMQVPDAEWLYNHVSVGTTVFIV